MDFSDTDDKLLQGGTLLELSEHDLEKYAGDEDLSNLLEMGDGLTSADLISDLPDDLDIPLFEPMTGIEEGDLGASLGGDMGLGASLGGEMGLEASLIGDEQWKDLSDGSDSGIDCLSVKQEPLSPTSSHCSDLSNDASQTLLMDAASIAQQSENDLLAQLNFDTTLGGQAQLFDPVIHNDIKIEGPDTPPLTPNTPVQYHVTSSHSILKPMSSNIVSTVTTLNNKTTAANNGTARAITFTTGSAAKTQTNGQVNNIKVVLPVQGSQTSLTNKIKIQPRPLTTANIPAANTVTAKLNKQPGKPLVLTPEEFAKLTAQGVLKLQTSSSNQTLNQSPTLTSSKPLSSGYNSNSSSPNSRHTTPITMTSNSGRHSNSVLADHPPPGIDIDMKAWKRQQRMIKNRESACLSRKRKKEYLTKVEYQLQDCINLNEKLHHENNLLKKKVDHLTKENDLLKRALPSLSTVKKVTSLLAIVLLFTFNFSSLSIFSSNLQSHSPSISGANQMSLFPGNDVRHHGRHLMALSNDLDPDNAKVDFGEYAAQYNINSIEQTMNLLRKSMVDGNNALNLNNKKSSTNALMALQDLDNQLNFHLSTMCPMYYNSTESQRLMNELTGWVLGQKAEFARQEEELKSGRSKRRRDKKRRTKKPIGGDVAVNHDALDMTSAEYYEEQRFTMPSSQSDSSEVQLFNRAEQGHAHFMDAVHRRNDTFYVVSFKNDHLLLPATSTNKTMGRPRMSLVLPAMGLNETITPPEGSIAMMQIDCEVTATRLLHIHKSAVPASMRDNHTYFVPPTGSSEGSASSRHAATPPTSGSASPTTSPRSNRNQGNKSAHLPRRP